MKLFNFINIYSYVENHWIKLYKRKQNRWWTAEFSRNGMFLLKPRHVRLTKATRNLMCADDDTLNSVELIFPTSSQTAPELVSFVKSCRVGMANIYSRLRLFEGIHPVCVEIENYELTGLNYVNIGGGWISSDLHFEFTCNHIRQYVLIT